MSDSPENLKDPVVADLSTRKPIRIGSQRDADDVAGAGVNVTAETTSNWSSDTLEEIDPSSEPNSTKQRARDPKLSEIPVPQKIRIPRNEELDEDLAAELGLRDADMSRLLLGEPGSRASGSQTQDSKASELAVETRLPASVLKVHRDLVFFVLPGQLEGVCSVRQFSEPPTPGSRIEVVVTGYSPQDGLYELGIPGASVAVADWSDLAEGVIVDAKITAMNTGGLECEVNHIRGFIPASQVSLYRIENLAEFVGQNLRCVVTEVNEMRKKFVLSHRAILERERVEKRTALLGQLEVGSTQEGTVTKIKEFGAFIDIGGIEGLVHISQLSWDRIRHPSEVLEVGQKVQTRVEKIDPQTGKISLSYRELLEHPWGNADAQFPIGGIVTGTVTRLMEFGAFVRVGPGMEGLVHISELSHQRVRRVAQVVSEGQEVQVKILSVDKESQRMSLSMKAAQAAAASEAAEAEGADSEDTVLQTVPRIPDGALKGGVGRQSGGDAFGLKW